MQLLSAEKETWLAGDVRRLTLKIAAPSVAAMVASAFCSLLETLILGRSDAQLSAAIGACFALTALEQTVGFTLGMGAGSSVSRCLGCGSSDRALRSASVGFFSALAISCVFPVIGLFFAAPALSLLGASAGGSSGTVYARYVCLCAPPLCGSLTLSSLLRAQGKTLPNMAAYAAGSILGAALLYIFCVLLNFGVHGAGAAMLIREIAIFAILLFSLCRDASLIRPRLHCAKPTLPVLREIMRSGLPSLLRQGTTSLSAVLLSRICAGFGAHALSGMGLAVRVCTLYSSALIGFGQGFQPVCGVNLGAGKLSRCKTAYLFCQRAAFGVTLVLSAAVFLFAPALTDRFAPDAQTAAFASSALRAQSAVFFAQSAVVLMTMLTQAMGMTLRSSLVATGRQGLFFIPLLLILPRRFGERGLIFCQSISDLTALVFSFFLTRNIFRAQMPCTQKASSPPAGEG